MSTLSKPSAERQLRLNIRLSREEWDKIHKLASKTTCRTVSEYSRKVLTDKPVKVFFRNQSLDDLEEQLVLVVPCLESLRRDFSYLTKKLSTLETVPEIKSVLALILAYQENAVTNMETIKNHIENLSDQCAQK